MMKEEFEIEAKDAAVWEVAQLLPLFNSLESIRAHYALQQQHNDVQLHRSVMSQVDQARAGIDALADSQYKIETIFENFELIDKLCQESQMQIEHYDQIKLLNNVCNNLNTTLKDVEGMIFISIEAAEVRASLLDERDLFKSFEALIEIEQRMQFTQHTLLAQRKGARKLMEYFEDVSNSRVELEQILWSHINNFFQIARYNPQTLVQALKIVEMQEILDQQQAKVGGLGYKDHCYKEIQKSIKVKFDDLLYTLFIEDVDAALDKASAIALELPDIFTYVAPCFPPQYKIFKYCVHLYIERFIQMLRQLGDRASELSNSKILKVARWVATFQEQLIQLGIEDKIAAQCGDSSGAMDSLIDAYVDRMKIFMQQCYTNLMEGDERNPPKRSYNGKLYTQAGVELFQILTLQIVQVKKNSNGVLLYRMALVVIEIMNKFQLVQRTRLEEPAADIGLELWCTMVNSNYKCYELALELTNKVMTALSPSYIEQVSFEEPCKGFLEVGKEALSKVVEVIFEDPGVKELNGELHQQAWYEGLVTESLVATFADYFGDVKLYLEERSYRRFAEACLERTIAMYVDRLLSIYKENIAEDLKRLEVDEDLLSEFFQGIISPTKVKNHILLLAELRHLASARSIDSLTKDYATLLQTHPDCPPVVVEKLVALREGIPNEDVNEVRVECRALYDAKLKHRKPSKPDRVFSRLTCLSQANC